MAINVNLYFFVDDVLLKSDSLVSQVNRPGDSLAKGRLDIQRQMDANSADPSSDAITGKTNLMLPMKP